MKMAVRTNGLVNSQLSPKQNKIKKEAKKEAKKIIIVMMVMMMMMMMMTALNIVDIT